ncbi:MAG TPA: tetratricopeptide repeat protein [Polyangiaceae bacterium]|nr:tetratricopeptide repeat protein [Polyangiaceae bacterium]
MDQFSAHLDRGWDLVQRGDTRGAEASARRALEMDPQSPEAYNLLGYVAALDGDASEAIDNYRQAIALDETYLEAMLNAAEVYIHPLGEFDEAIDMCDQALDLAETDEEIIDALLLKFDAMLGRGQGKEASQVIARMPEGPYKNPNHGFLIGRAYYEIGDVERASGLIEEAAQRDPNHAEAHYYLGLVRDEAGDSKGATMAFLRCRQLDLDMPSPSWALPRELFVKAVDRSLAALDPILGRYVRDAIVHVGDVPGMELVADGVDPRALVLLDGLGTPEVPAPNATRIFVYQRNIERLAGGTDRLEHEITSAFEREITATFLEGDSAQKDKSLLN